MDVPTLILLGAAGGLLRGVLDLYTRFVAWQGDRHTHRQLTAEGVVQGEPPGFGTYFDPAVDIVAAALHGVMGAGAAVLFGTTGQISGEYAALVVGMSAPILLTQLSRIQTVNELVTGADRQPAGAAEAAVGAGGPPAAGAVDGGGGNGANPPVQAPGVPAPSATPPRSEPPPAHLASPTAPPPPLRTRPGLPARPAAATADAGFPDPAVGELPADRTRLPHPARPTDAPSPADPPHGTGPGTEGRAAPPWRQRPAMGEEGL
ncbi:hypothetical protein ACWFQ8_17105 [Streptomyces sp. NPDC055254]